MKTLFGFAAFAAAFAGGALARDLEADAELQSRRLRDLEARLSHGAGHGIHEKFVHHGMPDLSSQAALAITSGAGCGGATALPLGTPVKGSNSGGGAIGDGAPAKCGGVSHEGSSGVWFRLPALAKGAYYATTCGSGTEFDTQVTVLEGSCGGFRCAADGDDDNYCGSSKRQSTVSFEAEEGKTYYVIVHGYKDRAGDFTLTAGRVGATADVAAVQRMHKTERYRSEDGSPLRDALVVRRGGMVDIEVTSAHALRGFRLRLPGSAQPSDGVRDIDIPAISPLDRKLGYTFSDTWAVPVSTKGHTITWRVWLPDNHPVGLFWLRADFVNGLDVYLHEDIAVLFNPLSSYDDTHIAGDENRAEYLFNEHGTMYKGTKRASYGVPWAYDQFNMVNLVTTMNLLKGSTLAQRRSPVYVSRRLTSLVNSNDNKGLMRGRWPEVGENEEEAYSGGKNPNEWDSSTDIFELYTFGGTKSRVDKTVNYAQCWVFAGTLVTAMRTLGIAARPVTNYGSAHEKRPYDGVVDFYYKEAGDGEWVRDTERTKDSSWSFHVWVEAWFKRKDYAEGEADGWQVIDATPQDDSSGPEEPPFLHPVKMNGPAPVVKINSGRRSAAFDVDFVSSELNAVLREHFLLPDGRWVVNPDKPAQFGTKILSKLPDAKCPANLANSGSGTSANTCSTDLRASGHYARVSVARGPNEAEDLLVQVGDIGHTSGGNNNNNNNNNGHATVSVTNDNNNNNNNNAPTTTTVTEAVVGEQSAVDEARDKVLAQKTANKGAEPSAKDVAPTETAQVDLDRKEEAQETIEATSDIGKDAPEGKEAKVEASETRGDLANKIKGEIAANGDTVEKRQEADGLIFSFSVPPAVAAGDTLRATLSTRAGVKADTGKMSIRVEAVDYRGSELGVVETASAPVTPGSPLALEVPQTSYLKHLSSSEVLRVTFSGVVSGSAPFLESRDVLVLAPDVVLDCPQTPVAIGAPVSCRASFRNPLGVPLTHVTVRHHLSGHAPVVGASASGGKTNANGGRGVVTVPAGGTHTETVTVLAAVPGEHAMIVTVMTKEMGDLEASYKVTIAGGSDPSVSRDADANANANVDPEQSAAVETDNTEGGAVSHDLRAAEHNGIVEEVDPETAEEQAAAGAGITNNNNNNNHQQQQQQQGEAIVPK